MTGNAPAGARPGNQARRWERDMLAALAGLSVPAWRATARLPMPGMRAANRPDLEARISGHVPGRGELLATCQRA